MEHQIIKLIITALCLLTAYCQFAKQLHSISDCLNNCAYCEKNQLDVCLDTGGRMCIQNYVWDNSTSKCVLDPLFRDQKFLLNSNGQFKFLEKWQIVQSQQCQYQRANGDIQKVSIMGLFQSQSSNSIKVNVSPYYQSMIISFNMIRNSWAPYINFLQIQVIDQDSKQLDKLIIDYLQRQMMTDEDLHTLMCDDQLMLNQKYQFTVDFRHKNITRIKIIFTSLTSENQLWGLTNLKIAFGCQNNLYYSGKSCLNCQNGFYLDYQHLSNNAPTCHQCTINCLSCTKNKCISCADGMVAVGDHCQSSSGFKLVEKVFHPKDVHCGISMLHSIDQSKIHKQAIESIPIKINQYHSSARLILDLYLTDTQWSNQTSLILQVDGKLILRVHQHNIHGRLRQKCQSFAVGFFSHFKIVTPFFQHNANQMMFRIYSADQLITDFAVGDVSLQIQLAQPPKPEPKPEPKPQPAMPPLPPTLPQPEPEPQPKKQQPQVPLPPASLPEPARETQEEEKIYPPEVVEKRAIINEILQNKNNVVISHNTLHEYKKNGELLISINYPFEVKNYPFIYCNFVNTGLYLSGKMKSSTNHLQIIAVQISQTLVNQTVIITMSAVQKKLMLVKRNLQKVNNMEDQIELGRIKIERYDVLDITQQSKLHSISVFFVTITWIFLVLTIILMMIGKGSIVVDLSNLIQVLFLHVYINGQFLTPTFKIPISGVRNIENLNYFIAETQAKIETWLLGNVQQQSPIRFTQFSTDINFSRAIYPIIIINLVFLLWFGILILISKVLKKKAKEIEDFKVQSQNVYSQENLQPTKIQTFNVYISRIVDRPFNFWYFVLKYQFLAVIWLCFLQFFNMSYPKNADRNETINAIFCIMCFICTLCWPVGAYLIIKHFYNTKQYIDYLHQYEDIFRFQLYQRSLPSNHHRYYMLLGKMRLILYAICCSYLGNSPIQALVILITVHILSIVYLKLARPILNVIYMRSFFVQYAGFICLEVVMIVAYAVQEVATKQQFFALGYLMICFSILLILNAIFRMVYKLYKVKIQKHQQKSTFKGELATHRIV